jgi:drug/metabolite transporter (DMT)-like permease
MTPVAIFLVLSAAVVHAAWNYLAKRAAGGPAFIWLFATLSAAVYAPVSFLIIYFKRPEIGLLGLFFMSVSALLHLVYYLALQHGYSKGDLSLVYPLARGTGPMFSSLAAVFLFGERPGMLAVAGICLIVYGVFTLTGGTRLFKRKNPETAWALRYGLIAGVIIASYTVWDKHAVSGLLIPPVLLDWSTSIGRTIFLSPYAVRKWEAVKYQWRVNKRYAFGVAILNPLSYILVLTAMITTPVSYVAPAREISILIGTFMGAKMLAEGDSKRRIASACIMILGVVALAFG